MAGFLKMLQLTFKRKTIRGGYEPQIDSCSKGSTQRVSLIVQSRLRTTSSWWRHNCRMRGLGNSTCFPCTKNAPHDGGQLVGSATESPRKSQHGITSTCYKGSLHAYVVVVMASSVTRARHPQPDGLTGLAEVVVHHQAADGHSPPRPHPPVPGDGTRVPTTCLGVQRCTFRSSGPSRVPSFTGCVAMAAAMSDGHRGSRRRAHVGGGSVRTQRQLPRRRHRRA